MKRLRRFNERIAVWGTNAFGSMGAFWLFFFWGLLGLLPWLPARMKDLVLLVSSAWIQLWALPLLAVGATVLNRRTEARARQDHEMIRAELAEIRAMHADLRALLEDGHE